MTIMSYALKERVRRKELYIVAAVACVILLLFGNDAAVLKVEGEPISGFKSMFGVLHTIVGAAACLLAMILSLKTIPNEYQQKTSHLVWVRGILQRKYHFQLALANLLASIFAAAILYLVIAIYALIKGGAGYIPRMIPGFFILCIGIAVVSLLVSVLSIKLPVPVCALVGSLCVIAGVLHGLLELFSNILGGFSGTFIKVLLTVTPDLSGIMKQAENIILLKDIDIHIILTGLLIVYILPVGFVLLKKKEA